MTDKREKLGLTGGEITLPTSDERAVALRGAANQASIVTVNGVRCIPKIISRCAPPDGNDITTFALQPPNIYDYEP